MTTNIRLAQHADAKAVLALAKPFATSFMVEEQAFHHAFSELLASSQAHLAVAETAQQLVGYVLGFEHSTFLPMDVWLGWKKLWSAKRCGGKALGSYSCRSLRRGLWREGVSWWA